MFIVIDAEFDKDGTLYAQHLVDTSTILTDMLTHPTLRGKKVTHADFLKLCSTDLKARESAGYNISRQLPGETSPKTRWQRLLDGINTPECPKHMRDLKLEK